MAQLEHHFCVLIFYNANNRQTSKKISKKCKYFYDCSITCFLGRQKNKAALNQFNLNSQNLIILITCSQMASSRDTIIEDLKMSDDRIDISPSKQDTMELPNFQVSHVIQKIDPIYVEQEEQNKSVDLFFNKMNEAGQEGHNVSQNHFVDGHSRQNSPLYISETPIVREDLPEWNNFSQQQPFSPPRYNFDNLICQKIKRKVIQIEHVMYGLKIQKIQLVDFIKQFKDAFSLVVRTTAQEWEKTLIELKANKEEVNKQNNKKLELLQQQLVQQRLRFQLLSKQSENEGLDSNNLKMSIHEMQECNLKLNHQLQQLQLENHQLKFQLGKQVEVQKTIHQMQEQINNLNKNIDQNNEYIFDLEQKVSGASLQLAQKQTVLKKKFEHSLQEERQNIEKEYRMQFQRIQNEIKQKLEDQLGHQNNGIEVNQQEIYWRQLQALKQSSQQSLKQFELQNMSLKSLNKQLELKVEQLDKQIQIFIAQNEKSKSGFEQQKSKIAQLQHKLKEKDIEVNYYRDIVNKKQQFQTPPVIVPKNNHNILVLQEYNNLSNSFSRDRAISPSSNLSLYRNSIKNSPKDQLINNILAKIRYRQGNSVLSHLNDTSLSIESIDTRRGFNHSILKPVSPESVMLQRQKDVRMRNISQKLEQLRADIRKQIGMMRH